MTDVVAATGFTLIAHASAAGQDSPATGAIDTTGANLLVVAISQYAGVETGIVSDNKGNTWAALTTQAMGSVLSRLYYTASPTVGSGHTFTLGGTVYGTIAVQAWSGANTVPFNVENGAATAGGVGGVSLQPGSVTPSQNNSLVVTTGSFDIGAGAVSFTINLGYAISTMFQVWVASTKG
jgi:hypothetical protein